MLQLAPIVARVQPLPALKEGTCGSPAPVRLMSVGDKNKVEFRPPVVVNCGMVLALSEWVRDVVQPEAMRILGAHIDRIGGASGYQCRNRAGEQKRSEHADANAIDILEFTTSRGEILTVAGDWRPAELASQRAAEGAGSGEGRSKASNKNAKTAEPSSAPGSKAEDSASPSDPRSVFLKRIHGEACARFKTVLGPDANADHWNHFHLDLERRRSGSHYCR